MWGHASCTCHCGESATGAAGGVLIFSMPWMIWMTARSDRFGVSTLSGIVWLVIGLVLCDSSHVVIADSSYVQPARNIKVIRLQLSKIACYQLSRKFRRVLAFSKKASL